MVNMCMRNCSTSLTINTNERHYSPIKMTTNKLIITVTNKLRETKAKPVSLAHTACNVNLHRHYGIKRECLSKITSRLNI